MRLPSRDALLDPRTRRALEGLSAALGPLEVARRLRDLPPEVRRAATELHYLRGRARRKFPRPEACLLTREGLEQATSLPVARLRAARFARAAGAAGPPADLTAGLGADAIALAEALAAAGAPGGVVAAEPDPLRARLLRHNLAAHGARAAVLRARVGDLAVRAGLVLIDPDRRAGGAGAGGTRGRRERLDPASWSPPWDDVRRALGRARGGAAKLHPLLDPTALEASAAGPTSWQWVSEGGESKELVLWAGVLAEPEGLRQATAIGARGAVTWAGRPGIPALEGTAADARAATWLGVADVALLRSDLVGAFAGQHGLSPLRPGGRLLIGERPPPPGLVRPLRVVETAPLDRKRVRAMLERHDVGPLVVRKDGHREPAEVLARRLRGRGSREGQLVVARLADGFLAFLVEEDLAPLPEAPGPGAKGPALPG